MLHSYLTTSRILLKYIQFLLECCLLLLSLLIGTRFSDGDGSSNEVQRTMLELINQLDGFDPRGNIKVLMATNRYSLY